MVSAPISAKGAPCPLCRRAWASVGHCKRSPKGTKCGVDGCKAQRFEDCTVDGVVVAVHCLKGHRWVKPI
jgi:hypothetical protein